MPFDVYSVPCYKNTSQYNCIQPSSTDIIQLKLQNTQFNVYKTVSKQNNSLHIKRAAGSLYQKQTDSL